MNIHELLSCGVCHALAENPMLQHCGHLFCERCLFLGFGSRSRCPICDQQLKTTQPYVDAFLTRLIDVYWMLEEKETEFDFSTTSFSSEYTFSSEQTFSSSQTFSSQETFSSEQTFSSSFKESSAEEAHISFSEDSGSIFVDEPLDHAENVSNNERENWRFYAMDQRQVSSKPTGGKAVYLIPGGEGDNCFVSGTELAEFSDETVRELLIGYGYKNSEILKRRPQNRRKMLFLANKLIKSAEYSPNLEHQLEELQQLPFWNFAKYEHNK